MRSSLLIRDRNRCVIRPTDGILREFEEAGAVIMATMRVARVSASAETIG